MVRYVSCVYDVDVYFGKLMNARMQCNPNYILCCVTSLFTNNKQTIVKLVIFTIPGLKGP